MAILNCENFDEAIEFLQQEFKKNEDNENQYLTFKEVKKILALRVEFPRDKIKHLKI